MSQVPIYKPIKRICAWIRDESNLLGGPALVVLVGASIAALGSSRQIITGGALISALGALWGNYSRNLASKKIAQKNEEIVRLSNEIVNTVTGGTSVAHMGPYANIGPHALIACEGKYPLYELSVRVTDLELFSNIKNSSTDGNPNYLAADIASFQIGTMSPNTATLIQAPVFQLHGTSRNWNIFFMARNGPMTQLLRMKFANGKWESATRVLRANGRDVAYEKISPNYPREPDGSIAW